MSSFRERYEAVFRAFGRPLDARCAMSEATLAKAEARLGVRIPRALREYYAVAGREERFNLVDQRLLPPSRWEVDSKRLVFMEENQVVCIWGVSLRRFGSSDPPVSEGFPDGEGASWVPLKRTSSAFLMAMLHRQAVCGGLPHVRFGEEIPAATFKARFRKRDWTSYGKLKGEEYFSRPGQVIALSREGFRDGRWTISIAAGTRDGLRSLADELGLGAG